MMRFLLSSFRVFLPVGFSFLCCVVAAGAATGAEGRLRSPLALSFEPNLGQFPAAVRYLARTPRGPLHLLDRGVCMRAGQADVRMDFLNSKAGQELRPLEPTAAKTNYLVGSDPSRWRTGVPQYGRVEYRGAYPGIDIAFRSSAGGDVEFDFLLAAEADARSIALEFGGIRSIRTDQSGALVVIAANGESIQLRPPHAYQVTSNRELPVPVSYRVRGKRVGFVLGDYDRRLPLVIDPVIVYSAVIGSNDLLGPSALAVDSTGAVYITGNTEAGFPVTQPAGQPVYGGGHSDAFIAKLNAEGTALVYATYFGGAGDDYGSAIAVDRDGAVWVAGSTSSTNLPLKNAVQDSFGGSRDAFVVKLDPSGNQLQFSSYLGGSSDDGASGIALDGSGNAFVTGGTESGDFPLKSAFQSTWSGNGNRSGFVAKFSKTGVLQFSSYFGGAAAVPVAAAVDANGAVYVTGTASAGAVTPVNPLPVDSNEGAGAFLARIAADGSRVEFASFLGSAYHSADSVAVDSSGAVFVGGSFLMKLAGNPLSIQSTAPLALADGNLLNVTTDANGGVYVNTCQVVGATWLGSGGQRVFGTVLAKWDNALAARMYSQTLGACGSGLATDRNGAAYAVSDHNKVSKVQPSLTAPVRLTLRANPSSCGTVTALTAPGDNSDGYYQTGTQVQLIATGNNCDFTGWQGDASGNANPMSITMNSAKAVTAVFAPCTYSFDTGTSLSLGPDQSLKVVNVTTGASCPWNPSSDSSWVTFGSTGPTTGPGRLALFVSNNPGSFPRSTQVSIGGTAFTVAQSGGPGCSFTVAPLSAYFGPDGGSGLVNVTGGVSCTWNASSDTSWVAVQPAGGTGTGSVAYTVAKNAQASSRSGTLQIAGRLFSITQGAASNSCFSLSPLPTSITADGMKGTFSLTAASPTCTWQASSLVDWAVVYPRSGNGSAEITYVVQPNPTRQPRVLRLAVGAENLSTSQAARSSCLYAVSPSAITADNAGGTVQLAVSTEPGCRWGAYAQGLWVTAPLQASGDGIVQLRIPRNDDGIARLFTVSVQDLKIPVLQRSAMPANGTRFVPLAPCRVMDTRYEAGPVGPLGAPFLTGVRSVPMLLSTCRIPATARAYSLNITAVPYGPLGYLTAWPQGESQPLASNLNAPKGKAVANGAIIPAGAGGGVSFAVSDPSDLVVDINGYFVDASAPEGLAFYPVTPCRVMDTRPGQGTTGAFGPPTFPTGGTARTIPMSSSRCPLPANAAAYLVNFTAVPTNILGYLTTWPTGNPQPLVSTLNSWDGSIVANSAIIPAGQNGSIDIFVSNDPGSSSDIVMDVNGVFAPPAAGGLSFYPLSPCRVVDTRPSEGKTGGFGPPSFTPAAATRAFAIQAGGCGAAATASAYALNVTVVPSGTLGYLTLWPAQQAQPFVSTLNSWDGRIVANSAIVSAGAGAAVSVFANLPAGSATDLVLDLFGYFAP